MEKYLKAVPAHCSGRLRYDPVSMLKTVLFGFMKYGYISLRELEDNCRVNLRFMYLMKHETPSYRTFGYFIHDVLQPSVEELFYDLNCKIFAEEHVDLNHLYIDGSKFEANANKYQWVWKKATEKSRYRLFTKITALFEELNVELAPSGIAIPTNTEYVPEYLAEVLKQYTAFWKLDEADFVHGSGHHKSPQQRHYERLREYTNGFGNIRASWKSTPRNCRSAGMNGTAMLRRTTRPHSCESSRTIWETDDCSLPTMCSSVLLTNTLLLQM